MLAAGSGSEATKFPISISVKWRRVLGPLVDQKGWDCRSFAVDEEARELVVVENVDAEDTEDEEETFVVTALLGDDDDNDDDDDDVWRRSPNATLASDDCNERGADVCVLTEAPFASSSSKKLATW